MLASSETPRPRPPAKARRASAMKKLTATPPPAYGSPFTFPSLRAQQNMNMNMDLDGLGSPVVDGDAVRLGLGWDAVAEPDRYPSEQLPSPPPEDENFDGLDVDVDEDEWPTQMDELKGLFVKADGIIKERENELGLASAACKGLYQNTVALQTKHQALLARLPLSPSPAAISSPEPHTYMHRDASSRNSSISMSTSDSALGLIRSPLYRRHTAHNTHTHTRKVSIASADISHLADQNAELLDKLEKLEAEATSADQAGRRELKRLEKEITFLRDALERTQAKSEELEEKVQDAVVGEAWRRKKEREARFRGMRGLGRERNAGAGAGAVHPDTSLGLGVRDFAPQGSAFGGPSELTSFFPTTEERADTGSEGGQLQPPEHALISQLLVKVKELEETNTRILKQQSETATQLSAVQRDTAHITKVYETLADPEAVELELDDGTGGSDGGKDRDRDRAKDRTSSMHTIRFMSLRRTLEDEMSMSMSMSDSDSFGGNGTCIVRPDFLSTAPKNRKSVMGLFDEPLGGGGEDGAPGQDQDENDNVFGTFGSRPLSTRSWPPFSSSLHHRHLHGNMNPFSDSGSGSGSPPPGSGALSPLHFFSPASDSRLSLVLPDADSELSPAATALTSRPTLQTELNKELQLGGGGGEGGGGSWSRHNHHLRASSLYDISQFSASASASATSSVSGSAPPSPSPAPSSLRVAAATATAGRRLSDWDGDEDQDEDEDRLEGNGLKLKPPQPQPQLLSRTPLLMSGNSLRLSVEPPTPSKGKGKYGYYTRSGAGFVHGAQTETPDTAASLTTTLVASGVDVGGGVGNLDLDLDLDATKSPRIKMISETLRARTNRWVERRIRQSRSRSRSRSDERRDEQEEVERREEQWKQPRERDMEKNEKKATHVQKATIIGDRLSNVVDSLVDRFDSFSGGAVGVGGGGSKEESMSKSRSRSKSGSRSRSRSRRRHNLQVPGVELEGGMHSAGYESDSEDGSSSRACTPTYHDAKSDVNPDSPLPSSSPPLEEAQNQGALLLHTNLKPQQNPKTPGAGADANPGLLLQLWLWFQFAIVVLVFVYAMAKRGPTAVLSVGGAEGEGGRSGRAVARRR